MIHGLKPEEERDLILSVGTHSGTRRLTPGQVSELVMRARNCGVSSSQIAAAVGLKDSSTIGRFVRLDQLPPAARDLIGWGRTGGGLVSMTVASEIVSAQSQDREVLVAYAQAHRLTKEEVRGIIQRMRRGDESLDSAAAAILESRPTVERRFVLMGAITDPHLRRALANLSSADRNDLIASTLSQLDLPSVEGSLRPSGFSISSEAVPIESPDELEETINDELARRLT